MIDLDLGSSPYDPDAPRPQFTGRLCPISIRGSLVTLLNFQMAPGIILVMSVDPKTGTYSGVICIANFLIIHQLFRIC